MFYIIVGLWIVGCLFVCGVKKARSLFLIKHSRRTDAVNEPETVT